MTKKIKVTLESENKFSPFWRLKKEYIKATDKVMFLKEYRHYLETPHNEQVNEVFISNFEFLLKKIKEDALDKNDSRGLLKC
jgi:hypothetical protein